MGCLKMNNDEYIRMKNKMGIFDRKSNPGFEKDELEKIIEETIKRTMNVSSERPAKKGFWKEYSGTIISCVVTAICTAILSVLGNYFFIKIDINNINTKVGSISTQVEELTTEVEDISDYLYDDDGVKDQLGMINEALNLKVINVTEEDTVSFLEDISIESNDISSTTSVLSAKMSVGVDLNGNVYIAEDLIGETILLTYEDEGKDVFFLGQYNENYHWDGYCVTNTYNSDGTLYGICESNFDDGKRIDYKTVLSVDAENNKWDYYSRVCDGKSNIGISIEYIFEYNTEKNFTDTNVRRTDMLFVDEFMEKHDAILINYYHGRTSDKLYNDDTGEAYLITFHEDGTVRTLYVGNFVNGYPHDKTNKAWNIAYAEEVGYYVHNTGTFSNGYADKHSSEEFTYEEIEELISKYDFDCELKWK